VEKIWSTGIRIHRSFIVIYVVENSALTVGVFREQKRKREEMIKEQEKLRAQLRESFSDECLEAIGQLCRFMIKNPTSYDHYMHETFEDIELLEGMIRGIPYENEQTS
jgi:hypothetical protein